MLKSVVSNLIKFPNYQSSGLDAETVGALTHVEAQFKKLIGKYFCVGEYGFALDAVWIYSNPIIESDAEPGIYNIRIKLSFRIRSLSGSVAKETFEYSFRFLSDNPHPERIKYLKQYTSTAAHEFVTKVLKMYYFLET